MFDKCLNLPSSPFSWKKSNIIITVLPAFECCLGSLSAFIFLAQAPASAKMPLPFLTAYQSPSSVTSSEKFSQVLPGNYFSLAPSPIDVVWMPFPVPQAALYHFHPSFQLLDIYIHVHLPEPWQPSTQIMLAEGRLVAEVVLSLMGVKWPRNPAWHAHGPLSSEPLDVCSLLPESSGELLSTLQDSAQISLRGEGGVYPNL